jgi:hypothetical protein
MTRPEKPAYDDEMHLTKTKCRRNAHKRLRQPFRLMMCSVALTYYQWMPLSAEADDAIM